MTAVQGLADIATIAIIQHRVAIDAQNLNSQLSEALNSRITIEQAKGKISQAANVDMDRAFQRLRRHAAQPQSAALGSGYGRCSRDD